MIKIHVVEFRHLYMIVKANAPSFMCTNKISMIKTVKVIEFGKLPKYVLKSET